MACLIGIRVGLVKAVSFGKNVHITEVLGPLFVHIIDQLGEHRLSPTLDSTAIGIKYDILLLVPPVVRLEPLLEAVIELGLRHDDLLTRGFRLSNQ